MLFQVQSTVGKFTCYIKGTGQIKVHTNDHPDNIVTLPYRLELRTDCSNTIYKVQLENVDSENITIGPILDGRIVEIESWGDLDIVSLDSIFLTNRRHEVVVPDYIPKSLKNLS